MATAKNLGCALLVVGANGHAMLFEPPSRTTGGITVGTPNCAGGGCLWFNNGAFNGCPTVTGVDVLDMTKCPHPLEPNFEYNNTELGTVFGYNAALWSPVTGDDWTHYNPWRRPGTAPVDNACGLNGGYYEEGSTGTGGVAFFGKKQGHKGTEVAPLLKRTTWIAGSEVEVAWGITANHGGGYQYRICKVKDAGSNITAEATEECFQQNPLEFVGDKQWLQFGDGMDPNNRTEIPAVRVTEGVMPAGSTWTRNPIPACNDIPRLGGHNHECAGPMFPAPMPGIFGFGPGACADGIDPCTLEEMQSRLMTFGIVDKVRVPEVPAGDYILSWRWDCEQLPQVWNNCADVKIAAPGTAKATKAFSEWGGCDACCQETKGPCADCEKCLDDKTGDCEKCWKPLPGFTFGAMPQYQCLGGEGPDGGPGVWSPGEPINGVWSPGCPKCWSTENSCEPSDRESEMDEEVMV